MNDVLITGAARGFGLALTRTFSEAGWRVFACARNASDRDRLQSLSDRRPELVVPIRFDVTEDHDRYRARQLVEQETESLDVLVNNAGINAGTAENPKAHLSLGSLDADEMTEMFRVNAIAPLFVVQTFQELLTRSDRPRVVNVSSDSGSITRKETPGNYSYAASKAALNMITRALANDVEDDGIVVTALHPGHLQTQIGGLTAPDDPDDAADDTYELIRGLSPEETGKFLTRTGEELAW